MTVNELNEESWSEWSEATRFNWCSRSRSRGYEERKHPKHFHIRLDANDFQNSTCFDRCYISCDTVHIELGKD